MQTFVPIVASFENTLIKYKLPLSRKEIRILQLNIGKRCNQACIHCHVNAGPKRPEIMKRKTMDRIIDLLSEDERIDTVDITGGAPELNCDFRYLVKTLRTLGKNIIDRCNLTIFFEREQKDTPQFLARHQVRIIASLPCYLEENVNRQRGSDVFKKSIMALQTLNSLGYGKKDSGLVVDLVFNPIDAILPPDQISLEQEYKFFLNKTYNIEFNRLLTITNMPIKRYAKFLAGEGRLNSYCHSLVRGFNPRIASQIMCRELLSVGWDGKIYDCDFNQALDIPLKKEPLTVWDISSFQAINPEISFHNHCFGCTAGQGSSCSGALIPIASGLNHGDNNVQI